MQLIDTYSYGMGINTGREKYLCYCSTENAFYRTDKPICKKCGNTVWRTKTKYNKNPFIFTINTKYNKAENKMIIEFEYNQIKGNKEISTSTLKWVVNFYDSNASEMVYKNDDGKTKIKPLKDRDTIKLVKQWVIERITYKPTAEGVYLYTLANLPLMNVLVNMIPKRHSVNLVINSISKIFKYKIEKNLEKLTNDEIVKLTALLMIKGPKIILMHNYLPDFQSYYNGATYYFKGTLKEDFIDYTKNNPRDMLGVSKYLYKIIGKRKTTLRETFILREFEKKFGVDALKVVIEDFISEYTPYFDNYELDYAISEIISYLLECGLNVKKVIKTVNENIESNMKRNRDNKEQKELIDYIDLKHSLAKKLLTSYKDYYVMLTTLQITDNRDFPKYPQDIFKQHDKVVEIYNKTINDKNSKHLLPVEYTSKLEDEIDDYVFKYPETVGEVNLEGHLLNHCVGSYVPNILRGQTNIMFMRPKDKKQTPYATIEIKPDGTITQAYKRGNRVLDKDERKTLQKWANKHNLQYRGY